MLPSTPGELSQTNLTEPVEVHFAKALLVRESMKAIGKQAQKLMLKLVDGLTPGTNKKIDNAPGTAMAVYVDQLTEDRFSVAHNYKQNGDTVPDPDMEFWRGPDGNFYPVAIQMNTGHYSRAMEFGADDKPSKFSPRSQNELCQFVTMWFRNIKAQQEL